LLRAHFSATSADARRALIAGALSLTMLACRQAATPEPPSGGQRFVLDYTRFVEEVEPIFERRGCSTAGDCHGGGVRGTFALSPLDARDPAYDFAQASLQVNGYAPAASPILEKPLALDAGGVPHAAKPFRDRNDADFVILSRWVATARAEQM